MISLFCFKESLSNALLDLIDNLVNDSAIWQDVGTLLSFLCELVRHNAPNFWLPHAKDVPRYDFSLVGCAEAQLLMCARPTFLKPVNEAVKEGLSTWHCSSPDSILQAKTFDNRCQSC